MLIGTKLRSARKARNLTLDQVAQAAGLTKGFVSRLERDDVSPSVASLVTVCDVLGLRVGAVFRPPTLIGHPLPAKGGSSTSAARAPPSVSSLLAPRPRSR